MIEVIRKIDAFPKALDDFRIKTTSGAIGYKLIIISIILAYKCFVF
jgi:hypothetical protein